MARGGVPGPASPGTRPCETRRVRQAEPLAVHELGERRVPAGGPQGMMARVGSPRRLCAWISPRAPAPSPGPSPPSRRPSETAPGVSGGTASSSAGVPHAFVEIARKDVAHGRLPGGPAPTAARPMLPRPGRWYLPGPAVSKPAASRGARTLLRRTLRLNLAGGAQRNRRSVPGGCWPFKSVVF